MEATLAAPATATTELTKVRAYVHELLNEVENLAVLEAIATLLATARPAPPAAQAVRLEDLLPAERAAVEEGLRQSAAGLGKPHAEVWAEYETAYGVKCNL